MHGRRTHDPRNSCRGKDPRPDNAPRYKGPRSAGRDGYSVDGRRARYDTPGNIVSNEEAERTESFHRRMNDMDDMPYVGLGGYDDD